MRKEVFKDDAMGSGLSEQKDRVAVDSKEDSGRAGLGGLRHQWEGIKIQLWPCYVRGTF